MGWCDPMLRESVDCKGHRKRLTLLCRLLSSCVWLGLVQGRSMICKVDLLLPCLLWQVLKASGWLQSQMSLHTLPLSVTPSKGRFLFPFRLPCFRHFICIHKCLCTLGCLTSLTIQVLFKKSKLLSIDYVASPWPFVAQGESLYCLSIFRFRYIISDDVLSFNLVMDFYNNTFLSYIFTSHSTGKWQV